MRDTTKILLTTLVVIGLGTPLLETPARAQLGTTGTITGGVKDDANGSALAGVTVVATSPALQGTAAELTDESGMYTITNLPAGTYEVTFYYSDITVRRPGINVAVGRATPVHVRVNTGQAGGEVITIEEKAPSIDVSSTKQGITVDQDYMRNIPLPSRTFEGALSGAGGSQGDALGISFSGSTSLENNYIIDGINTTGLSFGTAGSPILNNFIQEQEVITGGYDAEFGRSTGGVVNVVTKSGSNELHGTAFANYEPHQFHVDRTVVPSASSAIQAESVPNMYLDFGFDLGGPIIKDKLWFYVGFAPVIDRATNIRKLQTRVDREINDHDYNEAGGADGDGNPMTNHDPGCELTQTCERDDLPDVDRRSGYVKFEELERSNHVITETQYNVIGKLNFAVNPDHQGAVSFFGLPDNWSTYYFYGTPEAGSRDIKTLVTDTSLKWTSKFANNKTQVDAVLGWHRYGVDVKPHYKSAYSADQGMECLEDGTNCTMGDQIITLYTLPNTDFVDLGVAGRNPYHRESQHVLDYCTDLGSGDPTVADPFPTIQNCPTATLYRFGGAGYVYDDVEQRLSAKATVTERVKAAGHHEIKLGGDLENNLLDSNQMFTGGAYNFYYNGYIQQNRFVRVAPDQTAPDVATNYPDVCGFIDADGDGMNDDPQRCRFLDALSTQGNTLNWAAFLQDKWQILPNLTLKAGIRYEQQLLRYADAIQGTMDPVTGDQLGTNALNLKNLIAPRVGVLYDWTKEGRSKVYANFGRFYESIPMDINTRSFGGETELVNIYDPLADCNTATAIMSDGVTVIPAHPSTCPQTPSTLLSQIQGESTIVTPGVKPQYMDEFVTGVEYEVLEDLNVGVSYQNRRVGRVIEDVSVDGANTYIIANPGEFPASEENALRDEVDRLLNSSDPVEMERGLVLRDRLNEFIKVRQFDKPRRDYNAVQLTAKKRYSKNFFVQGSYTYSRTEGNYPGLFSPDNGQVDPNISSQYDLIELLTNRTGLLPHDRPHIIKLDGYYNFDLREAGTVTTGVRLRAQSGTPVDALGSHYTYGAGESFLIPRGTFGRTDFVTQADLHVGYGRDVAKDMSLEIYFDLFNIFNLETPFSVDEVYTYDSANPIVGGSKEDLPYLKHVDEEDGKETGEQVRKNLNFGNDGVLFDSLRGRVGLLLRF